MSSQSLPGWVDSTYGGYLGNITDTVTETISQLWVNIRTWADTYILSWFESFGSMVQKIGDGIATLISDGLTWVFYTVPHTLADKFVIWVKDALNITDVTPDGYAPFEAFRNLIHTWGFGQSTSRVGRAISQFVMSLPDWFQGMIIFGFTTFIILCIIRIWIDLL